MKNRLSYIVGAFALFIASGTQVIASEEQSIRVVVDDVARDLRGPHIIFNMSRDATVGQLRADINARLASKGPIKTMGICAKGFSPLDLEDDSEPLAKYADRLRNGEVVLPHDCRSRV